MAWNDQGGQRDPWGNNNNNGSPPDLDEAFRKLKDKLNGLMGGKSGGSSGGSDSPSLGSAPVILALLVLVGFWAFKGVYLVDEKERGVVMRFGEFHSVITPGFNWQPWIIDTVNLVDVTSERQYSPNRADTIMLTKDENIVMVPLTVQYNVNDVRDFVLNVQDPELTLEQATDSAIRHSVGSSNLDNVISAGREFIRVDVEQRLQSYLDSYGAGIDIIDVTLQKAEPPEQVKEAFDDVIAAAADKERMINEAEAYRNQILPEARGQAQRMIEESQAYRGQLIARAQGDASRFNQLFAEYSRAPEVTRERLYIDAMESVMSGTNKVMIDSDSGNNLLYLPLDQLGAAATAAQNSRSSQLLTQQQLDQAVAEMQRRITTTTTRSVR